MPAESSLDYALQSSIVTTINSHNNWTLKKVQFNFYEYETTCTFFLIAETKISNSREQSGAVGPARCGWVRICESCQHTCYMKLNTHIPWMSKEKHVPEQYGG